MKKLFREPLVHFLLIGLGLFLLFYFTGNSSIQKDNNQIVRVDQESLLTFIQYRSKAFNRSHFIKVLNEMKDDELQRLIYDYIQEEVLHREALALGLARDDYVIRRRLVQKLRFIAQGVSINTVKLSDADLRRYYETNQKAYAIKPHITFTHVFFDNKRHGQKKAGQLAKIKLVSLNQAKVPFTKAVTHGNRFHYHLNYVERESDLVASHFGGNMAKKLFALKAVDGLWQGPYQSPYGFHLVMVTSQVAGRTPKLEDVHQRVLEDANQAAIRAQTDKTVQEIIKRYEIQVVFRNSHEKSQETKLKPQTKKSKPGISNQRSHDERKAIATVNDELPNKPIRMLEP